MHFDFTSNPALTISLAMAAGMIAQALARHLRVPGIVILLLTGIVLGPDGLGIIQPAALGARRHDLIGFAVAVILFEGGLNLNIRRIREQALPIQRLLSVGVLVTAAGGAVAAHYFMDWDWRLAILFGTLVVVTGPTVITPLLRRIRVKKRLETVLETEGVLVDALGAIVAVVTLELIIGTAESGLTHGLIGAPARLAFGCSAGFLGGIFLTLLLRWRRAIPEGLDNVFTLAIVLALYQLSNAVLEETGIVSAIVAGIVVGNSDTPEQRELKEFKEQLTILLIGLLFVLLAADVRMAQVVALGIPGILTVLTLMFVVRPLSVILCTWKAGFTWREKAFLSWVAPRGIIAAAISSLFGTRLTAMGVQGGEQITALVFLVIAATVFFQGATAEVIAHALGLRRPRGQGYGIMGAHPLGRTVARILHQAGEKIVLLDSNTNIYRDTPHEDFPLVFGNALDERVLMQADIESRKAVIGLLSNGAVNLLFARKARQEYKVPVAFVAIQRGHGAINPEMVSEAGASVLFAEERDLELWSVRVRRGLCSVQPWRFTNRDPAPEEAKRPAVSLPHKIRNSLLPLTHSRGKTTRPVDDQTRLAVDDVLCWLVFDEHREDAEIWLAEHGWEKATGPARPQPT
jgi:NhaP-type Na+/H+ or K+/H+ antiporter